MSDKIKHTEKTVADYFQLSYEIGETFGAKLRRGIILEDSRPISIWVSKSPYKLDSFDSHHALNHMHAIDEIEPAISPFEMYGFDSDGYCFVTFFQNLQNNLTGQRGTIAEMERRFFKAVRLVHKVHLSNNYFGDLTDCSFWLNNTGDISLTGVMKLPPSTRDQLVEHTKPETLAYVAPEVLSGGSATKSADVYSLGMIGFKLLCNELPVQVEVHDGVPEVIDRSDFRSSLGLDGNVLEILHNAINPDPEQRYASAEALVEAVMAAHESRREAQDKKGFVKSERDSGISSLPAVRRIKKHEPTVVESDDIADKIVNKGYKIVLYLSLIHI